MTLSKMHLPKRQLGRTELSVSALGLGAQWLGDPAVSEREVHQLLAAIREAGINLIDTARSYGLSETRLGQWLKPFRREFVLSTKLGYDIEGVPNWTYECVRRGVDEALQRLQTDYLDIVHFHSCPLSVLQQGEVIKALSQAKQQGKIRCVAYSGENEALAFAIGCGEFDSVQCSVNLVDQKSLREYLPQAQSHGLGVLAKRPLANAVWQYDTSPERDDLQVYWQRWQAFWPALAAEGYEPSELALRFTAFSPAISSVLVGTTKVTSLQRNLATLAKGPLPLAVQQIIQTAFAHCGRHWPGLI